MAVHLRLFALIRIQELSQVKLSWKHAAELRFYVVFLKKLRKIFHEPQDLFQLLQLV